MPFGGISFKALAPSYRRLWDLMVIEPGFASQAELVADKIWRNIPTRYLPVSAAFGSMPPFFVGVIHHLEGDGRFDRHLHNGDNLYRKTVHVPKGRPPKWGPPYRWEDSAVDALDYEGFDEYPDQIWKSIEGLLYALEVFNGMGYRRFHPNVNSPYLWSKSNHFSKGKFVSDGRFDPEARSDQIGAAVIIRAGGWIN